MRKVSSLLSDSLFVTGFFAIAVTIMLGLFSFVLSYWAMREFARASGAVVNGLDIIWPLTVDFAMVVFGLTALFKTMQKHRAIAQRLLVILFSALSVLFNVLHSPGVWSSQLAASMPPFALVLALESLLDMITGIVKRNGDEIKRVIESRDAQWQSAIAERDNMIESLKSSIARLAVESASSNSVRNDAHVTKCFCGYDGDDIESHTRLHITQARWYDTAEAALDELSRMYPGAVGVLTVDAIREWQCAV